MDKTRKLSDETIEQVSGGAIFNAKDIDGSDHNNPWEVLDGKGNVLGRYKTRDEAIYNAGYHRVGGNEVDWDTVQRMRG